MKKSTNKSTNKYIPNYSNALAEIWTRLTQKRATNYF